MKKILVATLLIALGATALFAFNANGKPPIPPVDSVDLPRFMGDWYVIANIPTFLERESYDAIETYELRDDGKIQTTFRHRKGSFDQRIRREQVIRQESAIQAMHAAKPAQRRFRRCHR